MSVGTTLPRLDESLISNLAPFVQLETRDIRRILDRAIARRMGSGETVFREGASAERFFMLLDGYIRVLRITEDGEQVIALHIPSGELFGIARALGRDTYPATAQAAAECLILSWPMSLWDKFAKDYPSFSAETFKVVGHRLDELNNRLLEMATQQVEQRVANALLRLINQTGVRNTHGIEIAFPITRQDVSEMTGTTMHTVSRLLSAWEKVKIVSSTRKHIVISDPHALVEIAHGGRHH